MKTGDSVGADAMCIKEPQFGSGEGDLAVAAPAEAGAYAGKSKRESI